MQLEQEEGLKRTIGVRTLAANAVNLTVGAGIFALPAVVASRIGNAAFLAYIICTVLFMMVMLCFIETGTRVTRTGGIYGYVETAFGPFVGFLGSTLYWFGYSLITDGAVANLLADSLAVFFPQLLDTPIRITFMLLVFGGIGCVNVLGVKLGARLTEFVTLAKLIPLVILIVVGLFFIKPAHFKIEQWPSFSGLGEVSMILFFAFGGMECAFGISGEIKDPKRTIPRGIMMAAFIVFIFYLTLHVVAQGVLGPDLVNHLDTPLAAAANAIMGHAGSTLLVIGAAISTFGLIIGDIFNSPRLPFAAARDGLLPKFLARVHPKYATPYVAIIFYASLGFVLSISGGFQELATMASVALLLIYLGVVLATVKLRNNPADPGAFKIPGGLTVPLCAIAITLWFLSHLTKQEYVIAAIFLGVVAGIYGVMKLVKGNRGNKEIRK